MSIAADGTRGDTHSFTPVFSADSRYVAFTSYASNLVSGDTNGAADVFVRDRVTGATDRVSVASDGTQANRDSQGPTPAISADFRYVAVTSSASTLVQSDTTRALDASVH